MAAKSWGLVGWARPILDIVMSGVSETVDYQLKQVFESVGKPKQYLRVNANLLKASADMTNIDKENLVNLKEDGAWIAQEFDEELDAFVELLIK